MAGHWYERAIIYEVPVPYFKDGDGDGLGDFSGLTEKLGYLRDLGVTCLWLGPFYDSPRQDDGYDIRDYYSIDPRFGTREDFDRLLLEAERHGLRVIVDMAFNHTSAEHPWFRSARSDPDSPYRDFYLWSDSITGDPDDENVVGEGSVWTYDEVAGKYYHHTFFEFQPDLNVANPRVRAELSKVLGYWLDAGVAGFRLDAVPILLEEKPGMRFDGNPYDLLTELREAVAERRPDALLLAEGDVGPPEQAAYFGTGDRVQMALNFYLSAHIGLALVQEEAEPLERALRRLPTPPEGCGFANFIRSHDEWSFRQVSEDERREVFEELSPDPSTRIFGTGIRRRLTPLLDGDERRIRLANSILLSMPGTPVIYYGDEIGMGDDLLVSGRGAVRTAMQWSAEPHAGFSAAPQEEIACPVISSGRYAYERLNVASQQQDPDSLLNWMTSALHMRLACPALNLARRAEVISVGDERVLAHVCRHGGSAAVLLHNLSGTGTELNTAALPPNLSALEEIFSDRNYAEPTGDLLRLGPYGFRWFHGVLD